MHLLDLPLKTPQENLACDEALLDLQEDGSGQETLRFWESPVHFVVLGYSNKAAQETHFARCEKTGIPVLRRPSGGGTVIQGPGCLNYSLVLSIPPSGPLANLNATNQYILEKHRQALSPLLGGQVEVKGISDLSWNGLKFSGNAQRRKKNALLFHGTFLYAFDLQKIEKLLTFPSTQPDYRASRAHLNFVTNVPLKAKQIKKALKEIWETKKNAEKFPKREVESLVREKYSREEWNLKY